MRFLLVFLLIPSLFFAQTYSESNPYGGGNPNDSYITANDRQLLTDIRYAMEGKDTQISIHVDNGSVTLSGKVPSPSEAASIAATVSSVAGVQAVVNNLVAEQEPPNQSTKVTNNDSFTTENDKLLLLTIRNSLNTYYPRKFDSISINVSGGAVTLQGYTDSIVDSTAVVQVVSKIAGVESINNLLQIKSLQ